jgi:hypothetical protein
MLGRNEFSDSKNGGLPGVRSFFGRKDNGVNWVVVFNGAETQWPADSDLDSFAVRRIRKAVADTKSWPADDFFRFFK